MPSNRRQSNRRGGGGHPSGGSSANRPLYAIDFTAVACGKRIANTKRRVRWRFGFANPDALASGQTGTQCRGEEHDVTLVWSVTSGKRLIMCDGQEVHFSNSRSGVLDFGWTMRGGHILKVVAHATAPMSAEPGFRQYDFFVDGRSFFAFPKVYRLGLTGSARVSPDERRGHAMAESSGRRTHSASGREHSGTIQALETPHNPDEEEAYLREAIKASLAVEANRKQGEDTKEEPTQAVSKQGADLLIDFMNDFDATGNTLPPAPAPAAGADDWALAPAPAQPNSQWAVAPAPASGNAWAATPAPPAAAAWNQPPAPVSAPVAQPAAAPTYDQFGGSFAAPTAPVPQQSFVGASATFGAPAYAAPAPVDPMAAYGQPAPPAQAPAPVTAPDFAAPAPAPVPEAAPIAPPAPAATPVANGGAKLTMGSLTNDGLLAGSNANSQATASADTALQNLMGAIDAFGITGAAAKPPASANNPFDNDNILSNTTLGDMKASKGSSAGGSEKKPVMNAAPGAMVMANSQAGNWGGYGGQQQAPPQYSMSGGYGQQMGGYGQPPAPQMGGYGQPPAPQMGGYGQPPMGQPAMGQQPPMQQQQAYGMPQYGQQPPMQQNQWGAPSN